MEKTPPLPKPDELWYKDFVPLSTNPKEFDPKFFRSRGEINENSVPFKLSNELWKGFLDEGDLKCWCCGFLVISDDESSS